MKKAVLVGTIAVALGLAGTGTYVLATRPVPSPVNQYLEESPGDLDFLSASIEGVQPIAEWTLTLPWTSEMPKPGEFDLAYFAAVGPGPVIAAQSRSGTSLYSVTGEFLGSVPGVPLGFLEDGCLLTQSGSLRLYSAHGDLLWERRPYDQAVVDMGLEEKDKAGLVSASIDCVAAGNRVYCDCLMEARQGHDATTAMECRDWLVVYDREGEPLWSGPPNVPAHHVASPEGGIVTGGIAVPGGMAYREFRQEEGRYRLRRTIVLPYPSLVGVSTDGRILARDTSGDQDCYVVYREGADRALSFLLPFGQGKFSVDSDGHLYTVRVTDVGLVATCWDWPSP